MSEFWKKDKPSNIEEAMSLLRFGCVLKDGFAHETQEQFIDQQRTERRMLNCADYLERGNADLRAKLEEATKDAGVARAERDIYSARLDAAIKLIADILSALPPNAIKAPDGTVYEFNPSPDYAMKMLRAFKAGIDAAIAQGKGEK